MSFVPFQEEKIWGSVVHLFSNPHACVSMLRVEKDSYCSVHRHQARANQFAVQSGQITVSLYGGGDKPDFKNTESLKLRPGDTFSVPSGIWHRFAVDHSGHVVEVYWSDTEGETCRLDDIQRFCEGGKFNS